METWIAYCSVCDCDVRVRLDPAMEITRADVTCLGEEVACTDRPCPLRDAAPDDLRESLEFLPMPGGASGRSLEEATRLLEEARRTSVGRAFRKAGRP